MQDITRLVLTVLAHELEPIELAPNDRSVDATSKGDGQRLAALLMSSSAWQRSGVSHAIDDANEESRARVGALARHLARGETGDWAVDPAPMLPTLFSRLAADHASPPGYLPLAPLAFTDADLFPTTALAPLPDRQRQYARLSEALVTALHDCARLSPVAYLESCFYLLQKYTWSVPAAGSPAAGLSLFDQARTACALIAALGRGGIDAPAFAAMVAKDAAAWATPRWMLLGGDITGVQSFLYTITARGAARGLRGRSFYLQLIGEAVARWLLRQLDLPLFNLLYVGGGRFYLLTPLLAPERLAALRGYLDRALLQCHQGDLYLALGEAPLSARDLVARDAGEGFNDVWRRAGEAINTAKARKFAALPPDDWHALVFAPRGEGGGETACVVCRREGPFEHARDDEPRKCTLCASLESLGSDLRDATYLALRAVDPQIPAHKARVYGDTLRAFGLELAILGGDESLTRGALAPGALLRLGDTDFLTPEARTARDANPSLALGFYLLANVTPYDASGEIAEFSTLAEVSQGIARLGILRMDVDDLGALFGKGLGADASLARTAALSFLLRLYFEGWVPQLARRHNPWSTSGDGADHVYAIYSGGDDLFLVGSWDHLPALAASIRRDLSRFAAGHPDVHVSAGIALIDAGFPLYQAATAAGEALDERAKKRQDATGTLVKDAVDFLGQTLSWDELEQADRLKQEFLARIGSGGVPRSLLHTIGRFAAIEVAARQGQRGRHATTRPDQVLYGRWMWIAAYMLTRVADQTRGAETKRWVLDLRDQLVQPAAVRLLGLAARWAELQLRRERE